MRLLTPFLYLALLFFGCQSSNADERDPSITLPTMVVNTFQNDYAQLPEGLIVANEDSTVLARYINPTDKRRTG